MFLDSRDQLDPRGSLSASERAHLRSSDLTPAQHERLLIVAVCGETEGPARWQAEHRLMFGHELVRQGRIGEGNGG